MPRALWTARSGGVLVGVVAAGLLAGCTGGPSRSSAEPSPSGSVGSTAGGTASGGATSRAPVVEVPRVGACYRLRTTELARPTSDSPPVPCSGAHTARTIHVGRLDTVVDGRQIGVDAPAVQRQPARTCPRRLATYVGGSVSQRRLSRLDVVWFSPTLAEADSGARWFRCDLIAFDRGDSLLRLPAKRLAKVLDRDRSPDRYALCGTAAPGTARFERVVCARKHAWRAVSTLRLDGGRRYPGRAAVARAGDRACKDVARRRAEDTLRFTYGWEWPTAAQWAAGQRFGYCWVPD